MHLRGIHGSALFLGICLLLAFAFTANAGDVGIIKGTVTDAQKEWPMPGVFITLEREGGDVWTKGITAVTDVDGTFSMFNIPPGTYTLVAEFMGYAKTRIEGVEVFMDQTTEVNFSMKKEAVGKITEVIEAEAPPIIKKEKTHAFDEITTEELEDFPIPGRSFQAALELLPGVTQGATDGQSHVRGGRDNELGYYVDGHSVNDPVTGTFGTNLNMNSIESMEVITGGFNAEYGKYMSGMVNVVTKSGGNEFHGNVGLYYRNDALDFVDEEIDHYRYQPDFSLEGFIIPDRLTFFTSVEFAKIEYNREWMRSDYWWDGYDGQAKLTYRLTPDDKFVINFTKSYAEIGRPYKWIPEGHNPTQLQDTGSVMAKYTHIFTPETYFNLRYQHMNMHLKVSVHNTPGDHEPYTMALIIARPDADIWDELAEYTDGEVTSAEDLDDDEIYISGDLYYWYQRYTFVNSLKGEFVTHLGKDHNIKAGYEVMHVNYLDQFLWTGINWYVYYGDRWFGRGDPFDDWAGDFPYQQYRKEVPPGEDYSNNHKVQTVMGQYVGFIQDTWSAFPTLTVNMGLRYDYEGIFGSKDFSPRIGVNYVPNEKTKLYLNYGHFYNSLNLHYAQVTDESKKFQYRNYDPSFDDPNQIPWSTQDYVPSNLESEKTNFIQIGFERALSKNTLLEIIGSFKKVHNLYVVVDLAPGQYMGPQQAQAIGYADYWGLDFKLTKRLSNNWSARFSYSYSSIMGTLDWYDYISNQYYSPNRGELYPLDWDVPHDIKLSGRYELPWKMDFSMIFRYQSGYPYTKYHWNFLGGRPDKVWDTAKNSKRVPDLHSMDVTLGKAFDWGTRYSLKLYLKVYNLYNQRNVVEVFPNTGHAMTVQARRRVELGFNFKF